MNYKLEYKYPIFVITITNILLLIIFGTYLESYECIYNSIISGEFNTPPFNDWITDIHFLIFPLYAYSNILFPNIYIYGIFLFILTFTNTLCIGILFYNFLRTIAIINNKYIFIFIYLIYNSNNLLNLSSNRIAFNIALCVSIYIILFKYNKIKIPMTRMAILFMLLILSCLISFEVIIVFSVCLIILTFAFRKLNYIVFVPFVLSSLTFLIFSFFTLTKSTEAQQVRVYKEIQVLDRGDIDYTKLNNKQELEVKALIKYFFMDEVHFELSFYDNISKLHNSSKIKIFDGISLNSTLSLLKKSYYNDYPFPYLIILILFLILAVSRIHYINKKTIYSLYLLYLIPIVLCIYMLVPNRFSLPYYNTLAIILILIILKYNLISIKKLYSIVFILLFFIF